MREKGGKRKGDLRWRRRWRWRLQVAGGGGLFRVNLFLLCENNLIPHLSTPPAWLAGLDCVLFCPSLNNADGVAFQFGGERRFSRQVVTSSSIYCPPAPPHLSHTPARSAPSPHLFSPTAPCVPIVSPLLSVPLPLRLLLIHSIGSSP